MQLKARGKAGCRIPASTELIEETVINNIDLPIAVGVRRRASSLLHRALMVFDPFILAIVGTVAAATLLPARGPWVTVVGVAANTGIVLLFFLHGVKLSREAILDGARNWKLHLAVVAATFILFPILGLALVRTPLVSGLLASGILFLTLLPSTVQSSIAFTAIARGNVAAAVCSASFSNLAGIFVTPALTVLLMNGKNGALSLGSVVSIIVQLLLPFAAGHLLRPQLGGFITRRKQLLTLVDRGSILLVVYSAFGAAVVGGLWHMLSPADLGLILLVCSILLTSILSATWAVGRWLRFSREDSVVLLFCGSKKSLASGVPMASILFPTHQVGLIILPLMLFHQLQLIACAVIARRSADALERGRSEIGIR